MSLAFAITADYPLPEVSQLRYCEMERNGIRIGMDMGLVVSSEAYYSVDFPEFQARLTQPCQYSLEFLENEEGIRELQDYLRKYGRPGTTVELWGVWLGDEISPFSPPRWEVGLEDLNTDVLKFLSDTPCLVNGKKAACVAIEID